MAAAAAFLQRAVALTAEPGPRAGRALAAAQASLQAGAFDAALELVAMAEAEPLDEFQQARVDLLLAELAFVTSRGSDAAPLLVKAARRLQPIDPGMSRATYLDALSAAMFAGRLAGPGASALEVARAAIAAPPPAGAPRGSDLLLDGLAATFDQGYAAGLPLLRRALTAFDGGMPADEELRWLWLACVAALHVWDDDRWDALSGRYVALARGAGALSELPLALSMRAHLLLFTGDLAAVASLTDEIQASKEATGSSLAPYAAMSLAALRGNQAKASALIEATTRDVTQRGEGVGITSAELATAMLGNGTGRYREAMTAAQRAAGLRDLGVANWATCELIEAAARSGNNEAAAEAYHRLAEVTSAAGTDWALGVQARSRALLAEGESAEILYRESVTRLGRTRVRAELARAHLMYGEWLRWQRRRGDAREQLRTARQMLEQMGMDAFAERARRELRATGETVRKHALASGDEELTAQEAQIVRLARDGLSNPEIGARLFISARTVQYHLGKVFTKLEISSRLQLQRALPDSGRDGPMA
jgi:DNA-binding CsgD family transcriptional regulator